MRRFAQSKMEMNDYRHKIFSMVLLTNGEAFWRMAALLRRNVLLEDEQPLVRLILNDNFLAKTDNQMPFAVITSLGIDGLMKLSFLVPLMRRVP
jgi:hypothetical protein